MSENCSHDCSSCSLDCSSRKSETVERCVHVKKVIGVVSGKGGVGKSMVTGAAGGRRAAHGTGDRGAGRRHNRPLDTQGVRP